MNEKLKEICFTFACVTTGSLLSAAFFITFFLKEAIIDTATLWQILFSSAICSLGNFLYPKRRLSKREIYVLNFLHYVFVNVVVIGSGLYFHWFSLDIWLILPMVILVGIVFFTIVFISYQRTKKESDLMNQKLQEYRKKHST